jgi:hypothetical protein
MLGTKDKIGMQFNDGLENNEVVIMDTKHRTLSTRTEEVEASI